MANESRDESGQPDTSDRAKASSSPTEQVKETARADLASRESETESSATTDFQAATVASGAQSSSPQSTRNGAANWTGGDTRFCILRPHARGGLGQVFLAQDQELRREVALKEIQDCHADNPNNRRRFVLEAEITGRLEHPGIVPVYGLGQYADGRPFYAMRFIRGQSLKEAIEEFHGPGSHERLLAQRRLLGRFIDVCNTMQYAHDRGVIHRDLKPANIMLGPYGETLVVDWGLAKVLADREAAAEVGALVPESNSDSAQTSPGLAIGTPAFLSPEQAAGKLDEVGPKSDIYCLGATLYCIVTGQRPIGADDPSCNIVTMLSKVVQGDFPRPRQVNPDIDPALEAIILKAMALRPDDRYETARKLADDVEQWLADEPVSAWVEPWTVRGRRWVSRHRTLVTGISAAVTVGLISLGLVTVLLTSANRDLNESNLRERDAKLAAIKATALAESQRLDAEAAREAAVDEAATAVQVSNFMAGLFEQADPFVLGGHFLGDQPLINPSALDIVERGATRLSDRRFLREKPLVRATLLDKVGHVYLSLGEGAKAEPMVLEALELRQKNLPGDDEDLASSLHNVGFLHLTNGNLLKSAALFGEAEAMRSRLLGANSARAVTSRFHLALALSFLEPELARAESLLLEVLAIQRARLDKAERDKSDQVGNEALECVCTLMILCNVHLRQGQGAKALPRVLEMSQILPKVTNREFAGFIESFMRFQQWKVLQQQDRAEQSLRQALAMLAKRVATSHYLYILLNRELGTFLYNSGRYEEAEKVFLELEETYRKHLAGDAGGVASIYSLLANSIERGSLAKARARSDTGAVEQEAARLQHYARAAFEHGKKFDIDWYQISMDGVYLAHTHLFVLPRPDLAEAESAARECWHLRRDHFGAGHQLCGHPFRYWLIALVRQDKCEEIEKAMLELLSQTSSPQWGADESTTFYDAAVKLAESGRANTAVQTLRLALAAGTNPDQIRNNASFAPLHKLEDYQKLFDK